MTMKLFVPLMLLALIATINPTASFASQKKHDGSHQEAKHHFAAKEFEVFHDVLHPLQHEALPRNDFALIRTKAAELVSAGEAILKLSLPKGAKISNAVKPEMRRFGTALAKFKKDAAAGTDAQLRESYVAVHDTFEKLAENWPSK